MSTLANTDFRLSDSKVIVLAQRQVREQAGLTGRTASPPPRRPGPHRSPLRERTMLVVPDNLWITRAGEVWSVIRWAEGRLRRRRTPPESWTAAMVGGWCAACGSLHAAGGTAPAASTAWTRGRPGNSRSSRPARLAGGMFTENGGRGSFVPSASADLLIQVRRALVQAGFHLSDGDGEDGRPGLAVTETPTGVLVR